MDESIKKQIVDLVQFRVDCIRDGLRKELDATYIQNRNEHNSHDYEWYMNMIESGFGDEVANIEIEPFDFPATLPFSDKCTYCWTVEYKVFVEMAGGRKTLWPVGFYPEDEENDEELVPKVICPAFRGDRADLIAQGNYLGPSESKQSSQSDNPPIVPAP